MRTVAIGRASRSRTVVDDHDVAGLDPRGELPERGQDPVARGPIVDQRHHILEPECAPKQSRHHLDIVDAARQLLGRPELGICVECRREARVSRSSGLIIASQPRVPTAISMRY